MSAMSARESFASYQRPACASSVFFSVVDSASLFVPAASVASASFQNAVLSACC